jgi:hypothetical protein
MSKYTITIPHVLYEKAQQLAKDTAQSVDDLICTRLEGALEQPILDIPRNERAELQAMSYLSTDALWTIAREQVPHDLQQTMSQLMEKNSQGTLTAEELDDLAALVERGQRLTLRKAQAMKLLLERGYSVSLEALKPADE